MKVKKTIYAIVVSLLFASSVSAKEVDIKLDSSKAYAGAGFSVNSGSNSNATLSAIGVQLFAGYDLDMEFFENTKTIAEVGYAFSDARNGLGLTGLQSYAYNKNVNLQGRLGLDLSGNIGIVIGLGAQIKLSERMDFRTEFLIRDNISALQGSVLYYID
ncbi:MAG: hypothetical protein OEZ58_14555 [Gammaproteobacteria bacterium]|nr:hypothetical protein [Gammaproteobacteria bacterium]MDH5730214.1 hypothetical protein [Gammaproteobacteria bacterium]